MKALLYAPEWYWKLTPDQRKEITNGCGPGRIGSRLVPDSLLGLSINEACRIHDAMYHDGEFTEDKLEADRVFLNNMLRLIDARGGIFRWLRTRFAIYYYHVVRDQGGLSFWRHKNPTENMGSVEV